MGGAQTYQRRYLWIQALELTESDTVDGAPPVDEKKTKPLTEEEYQDLLKIQDSVLLKEKMEAYSKKGIMPNNKQGKVLKEKYDELILMKEGK